MASSLAISMMPRWQTSQMNPLESFWFTGAEGAKVQGFLLKPPQFDPMKRFR